MSKGKLKIGKVTEQQTNSMTWTPRNLTFIPFSAGSAVKNSAGVPGAPYSHRPLPHCSAWPRSKMGIALPLAAGRADPS